MDEEERLQEGIQKIIEDEIIAVNRPKLKKGEKYRFIDGGSIDEKDNIVKVIGTTKRIFIRPMKNIHLQKSIKSKKDIELKEIVKLKRETFDGIEIETEKEVYKLPAISDQKTIANIIAEDSGLTKTDFGKKGRVVGLSKKIVGTVGIGFGLFIAIGGIIMGIILGLYGLFFCLTIIGAIIGIPIIIIAGFMIYGALIIGGGCMGIGSLGYGGKEEWKRMSKKKGNRNAK